MKARDHGFKSRSGQASFFFSLLDWVPPFALLSLWVRGQWQCYYGSCLSISTCTCLNWAPMCPIQFVSTCTLYVHIVLFGAVWVCWISSHPLTLYTCNNMNMSSLLSHTLHTRYQERMSGQRRLNCGYIYWFILLHLNSGYMYIHRVTCSRWWGLLMYFPPLTLFPYISLTMIQSACGVCSISWQQCAVSGPVPGSEHGYLLSRA